MVELKTHLAKPVVGEKLSCSAGLQPNMPILCLYSLLATDFPIVRI